MFPSVSRGIGSAQVRMHSGFCLASLGGNFFARALTLGLDDSDVVPATPNNGTIRGACEEMMETI